MEIRIDYGDLKGLRRNEMPQPYCPSVETVSEIVLRIFLCLL